MSQQSTQIKDASHDYKCTQSVPRCPSCINAKMLHTPIIHRLACCLGSICMAPILHSIIDCKQGHACECMRPLTLSHKCIQPPLSSHFDSMSQELASQNQHEEDSRDMTYMLSPVRCRLADKRAKTLAPEGAWGWGHTWLQRLRLKRPQPCLPLQ